MTSALSNVKPYRLQARLKNNRLWTAIHETWPDIVKQSDAARRMRISPTVVGALLNMTRWPGCVHQRNGRSCDARPRRRCVDGWTQEAWKICKLLKYAYPPEWLFDRVLYGVQPNPVSLPISEPVAREFSVRTPHALPGSVSLAESPDAVYEPVERRAQITKVLATLTPREQYVIAQCFGEDRTYEQIGESLMLTTERVRQIRAKALRKLRHRSRSAKLRMLYLPEA